MMTLEFDWDEEKETTNLQRHGVSFARATTAFEDPFAVEWIDDREDYREERVVLLGMVDGEILTIVYTERHARVRLIPARRATRHEQETYYRQSAQ